MSCIPQSKENNEFCFYYLENRDAAILVCSLYVVAVIFSTCCSLYIIYTAFSV